MNADGTNQTNFTQNGADDNDPAWSPGPLLAFASNRDGDKTEIYRLGAGDGSPLLRLTNNSFNDAAPSWPPGRITFQSDRDGNDEIYTINAMDGSNPVRITNNAAFDIDPARTSDGSRVVWVSNRDVATNLEIYASNADGSIAVRLTNNSASDIDPAIQLLPSAATLGTIQLSAATFTVGEGQGSVGITVTRTGGTGTATVDIETVSGTASERSDFAPIFRTLTFAAGETSKTVNIAIIDDAYNEGDETFGVTLGSPTNAVLGGLRNATVTIVDNDGPPPALTSEFATGLKAPVKITFINPDHLLVAEGGDGPNTGRLSLLDRSTGARRTLLDKLPSGFAPPNNDPIGPSGLEMSGRTLFITIGAGDATLNGPVPATEMPNPNPSSPIFSSVLAIDLSSVNESMTAGFTLTAANQTALKSGSQVTLNDGSGQTLTIRLVVDFPDFVAEPRPNFAGNVRPSNPFGLLAAANFLYVVDAAMNLVRRVDINTGATSTLATFAPIPRPSPAPPPGGPVVEPVPDSVRLFGDQLLVPFLTGFPFQPGLAQVRKVDIASGNQESFITGLTSAIDVLHVRAGGADRFFVLEFSANMLQGAPGRLKLFNSPSGAPAVTVDNLMTPTSLARDERTGALFVTEIFAGRVVQITNPSFPLTNPIDNVDFFVRQQYLDFLNREADAAGLAFWTGELNRLIAACPATPATARAGCILGARAQVSIAFFLSIEFQETGYFVIRAYQEAFARLPTLREFLFDVQNLNQGVIIGQPGALDLLAQNRQAFLDNFVNRTEFQSRYAGVSNSTFVNALFTNAGVDPNTEAAARDAILAGLNNGTVARQSALVQVGNTRSVFNALYNRAVVLMQYFGYLRRNPSDPPDSDLSGFNFWLTVLNNNSQPGEDARDPVQALARIRRARIVEAFIDSIEYRARFGSP